MCCVVVCLRVCARVCARVCVCFRARVLRTCACQCLWCQNEFENERDNAPLEYGAEFIKVNAAHAAYTSGRRGSPWSKRAVAIRLLRVSGVCQARDDGEAQEALGSWSEQHCWCEFEFLKLNGAGRKEVVVSMWVWVWVWVFDGQCMIWCCRGIKKEEWTEGASKKGCGGCAEQAAPGNTWSSFEKNIDLR